MVYFVWSMRITLQPFVQAALCSRLEAGTALTRGEYRCRKVICERGGKKGSKILQRMGFAHLCIITSLISYSHFSIPYPLSPFPPFSPLRHGNSRFFS